ncbi:DctP family TRAP transporter solute-binding subunit [Bacillus massiliglaciei]|uniref:DctP family TRAP transporter solute-binding subunit n=1 Tax=Bacillus massiliglaciei TaxID=1816693 RepID=UPI000B2BC058|nr:DctP family TRAP transporter solute-binding subunit [Bacillus massiliglaciei]
MKVGRFSAMRALWGFILFIIIGVAAAIFLSFQPFFEQHELPHDEEQEGMEDQIIIKFSHVVAENTPKGMAANRFAKLVDEYTNHRVKVEVFPNESLYDDEEEWKALKNNEVQMIAPATSKLTNVSKRWMLLDLPYIFPNDQALKETLSGEVGQELLGDLEGEGIKGFAIWSNHFKQITSNQEIRSPEDFKGKNFRIMPSEVLKEQFGHFGATTSMLGFNETFQNLEDHATDSQENTISNIYSKKLYQLQNNLTMSNHGYLGYAVMMNGSFWESLPPDIQKEIQRAMDKTTDWIWVKSSEMNEELLLDIQRESDIHIYRLSSEERKEWMDKMTQIYPEFEEEIGSGLLDKTLAIRQKYLKEQP